MDELDTGGFEVFRCNKKGNRNSLERTHIAIFSAAGRWQVLLDYSELVYLGGVISKLRRRPGPIGGGGKIRTKLGVFEIFWCDKNGERNLKGDFIAVFAGNRWQKIFTYGEISYLDNAISNFRRNEEGIGRTWGGSGSQPRWILAGGFETNRRKH